MTDFDPNECKAEMKKCINTKMTKLKPATIIGMISTSIVVIGLTSGGVYSTFMYGVNERQANTKYMITAEATKVTEKLNEYCKKEKVYTIDKKLGILEEKLNNVDANVKKLDKRSEQMYEIMRKLERRGTYTGDD